MFSVQCLLYSRHWNHTCLRFSMACLACGRESWPCFIEYKNWRMVDSGCFPPVCICLRLILGRLPSRIFNEGVAACVACGRESWHVLSNTRIGGWSALEVLVSLRAIQHTSHGLCCASDVADESAKRLQHHGACSMLWATRLLFLLQY